MQGIESSTHLKAALGYSQRLKWPVFPLVPKTKKPLTTHGFKDATNDLEKIYKWWRKYPEANIGIPTGKMSGFFVVDVDVGDGKVGAESLQVLTEQYGKMPETVECISGSGGTHYLLNYQVGITYNKEIAKDIDIKSDGGYVVAPPSIHPNGKKYEWELSSHPLEVSIANAPEWVIHLVSKETKKDTSRFKAKPVTEYIRILQGVSDGERNNSLVTLIGHLLAKNINYAEAYEIVHMWNQTRCHPPLPPDTVTTAFNNILRREVAKRGKNIG